METCTRWLPPLCLTPSQCILPATNTPQGAKQGIQQPGRDNGPKLQIRHSKSRKKLDLREVGERRLEGNLFFQRLKQCDADEEDAEEKGRGGRRWWRGRRQSLRRRRWREEVEDYQVKEDNEDEENEEDKENEDYQDKEDYEDEENEEDKENEDYQDKEDNED